MFTRKTLNEIIYELNSHWTSEEYINKTLTLNRLAHKLLQ